MANEKPKKPRGTRLYVRRTEVGGASAWIREAEGWLWGVSLRRETAARMTREEATELQGQIGFRTTLEEA